MINKNVDNSRGIIYFNRFFKQKNTKDSLFIFNILRLFASMRFFNLNVPVFDEKIKIFASYLYTYKIDTKYLNLLNIVFYLKYLIKKNPFRNIKIKILFKNYIKYIKILNEKKYRKIMYRLFNKSTNKKKINGKFKFERS